MIYHNIKNFPPAPRLVVGGIYKYLKEMMKLPWNSEIKTHTVHVTDLVKATYFLCKNGTHGQVNDLFISFGKIFRWI